MEGALAQHLVGPVCLLGRYGRSYANHGRRATRLSTAAAPAVVVSCLLLSESLHGLPVRHIHHGDDSVMEGSVRGVGMLPTKGIDGW